MWVGKNDTSRQTPLTGSKVLAWNPLTCRLCLGTSKKFETAAFGEKCPFKRFQYHPFLVE